MGVHCSVNTPNSPREPRGTAHGGAVGFFPIRAAPRGCADTETKPRIGLTFRFPKTLGAYEGALARAGGQVLLLDPAGRSPDLHEFDGLVLSGGRDINPSLYGETPWPETQQPADRQRDAMESRLLTDVLPLGMPVLAICRGMQLANVVRGGKVLQDLKERCALHNPHGGDGRTEESLGKAAHRIAVRPDSILAGAMGSTEHWVNSRHHQAVSTLAECFTPTAWAEDGVIEAMEMEGRPNFLAVQWHPEDRAREQPADQALFDWLIRCAREFAQKRKLQRTEKY